MNLTTVDFHIDCYYVAGLVNGEHLEFLDYHGIKCTQTDRSTTVLTMCALTCKPADCYTVTATIDLDEIRGL